MEEGRDEGTRRPRVRGQGRLFQRGRRWWIAYYASIGGVSREIRESGGDSRTEARNLLRQRLDDLALHRQGIRQFQGPASEKLTISDLLDSLEKDYRTRGRKSLPQLLSRKKRLEEYFKLDRAVGLGVRRIQQFVEDRLKEGARPATVNRDVEVLQRAFTIAREAGLIFSVPVFRYLPELNAREGFFQLDQFDTVLGLIKDGDVRDYLTWFFWTGMRPLESKSLTWAALDKQSWTLTLPGRDAKTGKPRTLALVGPLKDLIKKRIKARHLGSDRIFHRRGRVMGEFRKVWKNACQKAGVGDLRPYDLRRTAVRNMVRAGVDPSIVMKISGHRTRSVFDRYNIVADDDLREAVAKLDRYVSEKRRSASRGALSSRKGRSSVKS